MTNLDKIRQLSVDEMAEIIAANCDMADKICLAILGVGGECDNGENCKACIAEWLESEAAICTQ